MDKHILTHIITASSYEEVDRLSREWLKKMRGKIEILEMEEVKPHSLKVVYYLRDTIQVALTIDELQCISEWFHDAVKDFPCNKLYRSIERKANRALGWE
jgi:hypothetical protein